MGRSISERTAGRLLAAAVASVALAGFGAAQSDGGLTIDLRALSVAGGSSNEISPGGKTVFVGGTGGRTVTIGVYARISGTNGVQNVVDVNGDQTEFLSYNDDTLNTVVGSFQSTGTLKGNMAPVAGPISTAGFDTRFAPMNQFGSTNGYAADFDSDGDLDIGELGGGGADATKLFAPRATGSTFQAASDSALGAHGWTTGGSTFTAQSQDTLIDKNTNEVRIGTLKFMVTGGSFGAQAALNFLIRQTNDASAALWFEDGSTSGKNPTNGLFSIGAPVTIEFFPEPSPLALLAIAPTLGLLAHRRASSHV
jgi:hypothetical protein